MKHILLIYSLLLHTGVSIMCQSRCFEDDILWITTQTALDSLMATVPGCTVFEGNLLLYYDDNDPITSLASLDAIEAFPVQLAIINQRNLITLAGLEKVKQIGSFLFRDNASLESFAGLSSLEEVSSRLIISRQSQITDFTGLDRLKVAGREVEIAFNDRLESLKGLDSLEIVEDRMYIGNNRRLTTIDNLQSLSSVGDDLIIVSNDRLTAISGLERLRSAPSLTINGNPLLEVVTGFSNLEEIADIRISNNVSLTDISGLSRVDHTGVVHFDIWNNTALTTCNIDPVCRLLHEAGTEVFINNNGPGCSTEEEVAAQCVVSTDDVRPAIEVEIYPNPVADRVSIAGAGLISAVRVIDARGTVLLERVIDAQKATIVMTHLPSGFYFFQITSATGDEEVYTVIKL